MALVRVDLERRVIHAQPGAGSVAVYDALVEMYEKKKMEGREIPVEWDGGLRVKEGWALLISKSGSGQPPS